MSAFEQDEVQRRVRHALFGAGEHVTIGRFALLCRIGKGSMGLVYAARDTELDRLVAVKVLELEYVAPEHRRELARRMQREAQALARIRHPHVVAVYEAGAESDFAFIVMEHVDGESLDRWLDTGERSIDAVLDVLVDAGRGLSAAHLEGLVHRDFKRENVLVDREGRAKVADLGLVRALEPEEQTGALRTALTAPGAVVGTIATMAPEQLRGERPDAASDQFSFAVAAWESLYRESPFPSGALADRLRHLTHAKLRDPPADALVPPAVHRVLVRALAAEPAHRFPSMDALVAALERARTGPERDALLGGRYRLLDILGEGGMGAVHRARDESEDREVAIKLIVADPRARQRVAQEARAASRLAHPGIVRVLDVDEAEGYLVMELIEGQSLRELLRRGPLELREALAITAELARTLADAHDAGLVHRDVKPDNVIRRSDGRTVLLDLGLAAAAHEAASGGTPGYMAPEQVRGEGAGAAADQFALAVTAYELIAGRSPWRGGHAAVLAQTLEVDPPPCSDDPAISAVIARGMAKEAGDRYPDLRAFACAIEQAARRPSSHRWRWATLALATAALAIGAALRADPAPSSPPASPLAAPDSVLACPVLEPRGVEAPAGWLGAAAADLACRRAQWLLGGRLERVRMPGHLLDLPRRPSASLPVDPYSWPDARGRSLQAARRHDAWLDGSIERAPEGSFSVHLAMHTREGLLAQADGAAATLSGAVDQAMEQLGAPLPRAARLDPEVARFFGSDDVELALRVSRMRFDGTLLDASGLCRELVERRALVATDATLACRGAHPSLEGPAVRLDRSSHAALARTAPAYLLAHPEADARALAEQLAAARAREPSLTGRVRLAIAEGRAFTAAGDAPRAQRALLAAARLAPHDLAIWQVLTTIGVGERSDASARRAYAAWAPSDAASWDGLAFTEDRARVGETRYQRRAFELMPSAPLIGVDLARRYLRSGHPDEARSIAADLASRGPSHALASDLVASFIDASETRFSRALDRLLSALSEWAVFGDGTSGDITALDFVMHLADLLGREHELGDAIAERFVLATPHRLHPTYGGGDATMINACRRARRSVAERCLERMRLLDRVELTSDDARLLEGALRYVRGDVEGAVDAWRPLVPLDVYRLEVPAEAFDRAGEPELARQIDAPRLSAPAVFGGAHLAHAREAKRAQARGQPDRARELARQVIAAWSTADAPVPVLAEMRELSARP